MTTPELLIIRNRTLDGARLRPSDWAERLSSAAATFENQRLVYSKKVMPCKRCEGHVCLKVDKRLQSEKPEVFETILDFMKINRLGEYTAACPQHAQPLVAPEPVWVPGVAEEKASTVKTGEAYLI
ncbi:MAG: DUF3579 domain-containing protein [bacterium]